MGVFFDDFLELLKVLILVSELLLVGKSYFVHLSLVAGYLIMVLRSQSLKFLVKKLLVLDFLFQGQIELIRLLLIGYFQLINLSLL